jgi:hypothetical protein
MSPSLENCPNEVFETIVGVLALRDICALRLCNRTLATKSTQDHFRSYFRSKHIDVTGSSLQAFINATQPDRLGCLIQHLVLVGVVNNTQSLEAIVAREKYSLEEYSLVGESESESENEWEKEAKAKRDLEILKQRQTDYKELHESGTDVSLLSEAFSNIATNSKTGKLLELSLEVVVYRENAERRLHPLNGGGWRFIWKSATNTYHTAIRALAASKLPIKKLSIFNDRRLQRCSLGCNELGCIDFEDKGLAISLASLKSLSVSLSDRIIFQSTKDVERSYDPDEVRDRDIPDHRRDRDEIQAETDDEGNFIGLAKLLQLCSQLEDLEIHYYRLRLRLRGTPDPHRERVLQRVAEAETLPKLKRLELHGVYVREQDLLTVIQRTSVRKLFMHGVIMYRGTFRSTFDYCTSDAAGMEELYFHKLLEGERSFSFEGLGAYHSQPPLIGADPGPRGDTLQREGDEIKEQIIYSFRGDNIPAVITPQDLKRRVPGYREYGPPDEGIA